MIYCRQHFVLLESTGPEMSSGNASSKVGFSLNTCSRSTNRGVMCSKPTEWCWYWHQSLRPCWYGAEGLSINQYAGHIQVLFDQRIMNEFWPSSVIDHYFTLCYQWLYWIVSNLQLTFHCKQSNIYYPVVKFQYIGQSRAFDLCCDSINQYFHF